MNIFITILMIFYIAINTYGCSKQIQQGKNDPLPKTRPEKLVIEYHIGGGMRYYSEALYISEDSSYYTVNDGGSISRINFKVTPEQLDNLYKVFKEHDFDRIKTYEEKVYDRGGSTIFLRWADGKFASVSNSGMTFIEEGWREQWNNCTSTLKGVIESETEKQKKEFEIKLDKAVFEKEFSLYVNNEPVISPTTKQPVDEVLIKTVRLIPGKHRMSYSYDKQYNNIQLDIDSSKGIFLYVKNDSLQHVLIK